MCRQCVAKRKNQPMLQAACVNLNTYRITVEGGREWIEL
jgi:hypothetical protein